MIASLAALDPNLDIAITTNASLLPRWAEELKRAGLRRITISLDSLAPDIFRRMNGERFDVGRVLDGIAAAEAAGFAPLKINCVVQRGVNDHGILDLARHFHGTGHILRFIEFMDVGTRNEWKLEEVVPGAEIVERISAEMPLSPADPNYAGEVAARWRYNDGGGEIGVITSVSAPFCGDCTRARLTTEGSLVTCLFADGGVDLRGPLREGASDEELRQRIASAWQQRSDRYSEQKPGNNYATKSTPATTPKTPPGTNTPSHTSQPTIHASHARARKARAGGRVGFGGVPRRSGAASDTAGYPARPRAIRAKAGRQSRAERR